MQIKFPAPVSEMPVSDIDQAIAYYQDQSGFTHDWGGKERGLA